MELDFLISEKAMSVHNAKNGYMDTEINKL